MFNLLVSITAVVTSFAHNSVVLIRSKRNCYYVLIIQYEKSFPILYYIYDLFNAFSGLPVFSDPSFPNGPIY